MKRRHLEKAAAREDIEIAREEKLDIDRKCHEGNAVR